MIHNHVHLTQRTGNLGPNSVDVVVESLEGEDLELGLLVSEKSQHSAGCNEAWHCVDALRCRGGCSDCISISQRGFRRSRLESKLRAKGRDGCCGVENVVLLKLRCLELVVWQRRFPGWTPVHVRSSACLPASPRLGLGLVWDKGQERSRLMLVSGSANQWPVRKLIFCVPPSGGPCSPQLCHKAGWTAGAAGVAECDSCPLRPETFVFVSFWLLAVTGASCSQSVYISLVHRNTQLRSAQAGAELDEWILECRQRVSVLISGHAIATDLVSCASGRHRCRKREKTHC